MTPQLRIAAITDEFSPDLDAALRAMDSIGMTGAELRVLWGRNIMDLSEDELRRAQELLRGRNVEVISIASPLLKCVLPGAPDVDTRFQQDVFASKHTFEDQARLAEHAFKLAGFFGAKIIRVFSYWRTVDPDKCFDAIVSSLLDLAEKARAQDLIIGLENEHACNIGTAAEAARVLKAAQHPNLKLVWDPANALVGGENPFPAGYNLLPADRIVHVHAKDCHMEGHKPIWGPVGTRHVDWKGQIAALRADGYTGWLSLETHWQGPGNDKMAASTICGWNLRGLAAA
ncbi:MAG TPA: sugar phosphate isomerase/epimerase family protein [Bryobacteraceae bacterium]|nr:sugar phosphate isomerase/epimerase family protein [Bryobacteraceae bacterium]